MPQIGPLEIAVVLLIALLVFGPNRLPEMAKQVGGALRELRRIQHTIRQDINEMMADDQTAAASPPPTLPPLEGPAAPGTDDRGLPPPDVPTSGSAEATGSPPPAEEPD